MNDTIKITTLKNKEIPTQQFEIEITEILQRRVKVNARDKEEAIEIVKQQYYGGADIVLDYSDMIEHKIEAI